MITRGARSVPGAVATGSKSNAWVEFAKENNPVAAAPGTDFVVMAISPAEAK
jgi:hypothetical protein